MSHHQVRAVPTDRWMRYASFRNLGFVVMPNSSGDSGRSGLNIFTQGGYPERRRMCVERICVEGIRGNEVSGDDGGGILFSIEKGLGGRLGRTR